MNTHRSYTIDYDPTDIDAEVARAGAAGEFDSPWADWDDEEIDREFMPLPATWRVGRRVPRNIYKNDEPVAMLAGEYIAREIVELCNGYLQLNDLVHTAYASCCKGHDHEDAFATVRCLIKMAPSNEE